MKSVILLILACGIASSQVDSQKLPIQVAPQAMESLKSVPEDDKAAILACTSELLKKHVTFRTDGMATTYWNSKNKQLIEWKGLVVRSIQTPAITQADKLNGTTKRFFIYLGSDAHRTWTSQSNSWGKWSDLNSSLFPSRVDVEMKDGKWTAIETDRMKKFSPGPGLAVAESKPASQKTELPAGMTREN